MASPTLLTFDAEGRAVAFDVWLDDLQLFLQCDSRDGLSLFDLTSGASTAPAADADSTVRSQWLMRDAAARLAVCSHLSPTERAHFNQYKSAKTLYDAVVARYSSPATAALSRLMLLYLFPDLAAFATVTDLITHLRTSDTRYRAALPAEDHFLSLCPTTLTVDLLEECLLAAEVVAEVVAELEAAVAVAGGEAAAEEAAAEVEPAEAELCSGDPSSSSALVRPLHPSSFCGGLHATQRCFDRLTDAWCAQSPDATEIPRCHDLLRSGVAIFDLDFDSILAAMYAVSIRAEGDCYMCVPPDPCIKAAALGASESAAPGAGESDLSGTASAQVFHSFTLDSGASRSFFRDRTTLTPLSWPVAVSLADPSGGPVLARYSTVLPCPAAPSGSLSGLYLPSFSTNLVSGADLQDAGVDQFTPAGQRVTHCTCAQTGRHLATFTRGPGSSLYTLTTESPPVAVSSQVAASSQVFAAASRSGPEHGLPCPCLWSPPVPPSPSLGACPYLRSMRRVWGSRAFARDLSADKLSSRAVPCVFLGFPPDAPGWQFYHPTSRRVPSSQDVTVSRGPAPSGVSQVDAIEPVEVAADSGASRGAEPGCAESGGAVPGCAEPGDAGSRAAEPGGVEPGGAGSGGALPERAVPWGTASEGAALGTARSGGVEPARAGPGGPSGALSRHHATGAGPGGSTSAGGAGGTSPGGARTGGTGAAGLAGAPSAGAGGAAGGTGAGAAVSAGGPAGAGAAGGTGAGGAAGVGADAGSAGVVPAGSRGAARPRPYFVPLLEKVLGLPPSSGPTPSLECPPPVQSESQLQLASPVPAPSPYTGPTGGLAERREPESRPASPVCTARTSRRVPRPLPPAVPGTHLMTLRPSTAPQRVPLLSPSASSLPALADPASDSLRAASPTVTRLLATVVTDPSFESSAASALVTKLVDFAAHYRLDFAACLVAESAFVCPPSVGEAIEGPYSSQWQAAMDADMASWKSTGTYVDEVPPPRANIVSGMWIFRVKRPPGSPPVFKARYVARGFSQRQGVDYFQTFSPTPKMTTLRVLLHVAAQRDYELHSLDLSTAFLQGSLHEEIWLRRPPGFTGSFPPGTQWSLWRPVYGLRQAPREWHDTLRTTLVALGFAPSTADPSLFLRTDTLLPPFYILVYVDDLVFVTADTPGLAHVKSELQKRHTCTDLGELPSYLGLQITRDRARCTITLTQSHMVQQVLQRFDFTYSSPQATPLSTRHSLSALPSDESVEPSGLYPELVGCLMYLMTCTRPHLAYPLSILARYVAPGRHRPEHMAAAKRVLRYLCGTSGLGLVLGGRSPVVLTGHADASWVDDLATQQSSQGYTFSLGSGSVSWRSTRSSSVLSFSCEAEIYAEAMAAQELRWLTYLLTDLGEPPRSPPVLYVDNKAMLALCREHRMEHRTKHIAFRYFLAHELQQRGQLRLVYVASQANTADIFTKALQPCDHQHFCTILDCRLWAAEDGGEHFCKHDARHGHTRLCGSGLLQHMQGHHYQRCVQASACLSSGNLGSLTDPTMDAPADAVLRVAQLALTCTAERIAARPSMAHIANELQSIREEVLGKEELSAAVKVDAQVQEKGISASVLSIDEQLQILENN
ncbi:unnamed protein product [Closterium sp. NIES-54]